ncbi:hypothetical protein [Halogeometricum limi]|uniref:hypothetical protein n=1 Tax=Halogeometricum limi TaxID=555875 RepID=UPI001114437D|nr:hypothetical protein [Halogeometricum limi]
MEFSDQEYYYVVIKPDADQIVLKKRDLSGTYELEKNFDIGLVDDEWYRLVIDWRVDGAHTVTLFEEDGTQITQLSAKDSTWSEGGIGLFGREANTGATVYFDEVQGSSPLVGNFEVGENSWFTTANNTLTRLDNTPAAITNGATAIEVTVNDDPQPVLENEVRIQNADLESYPYLLADVVPVEVENSDSPVTFKFRYTHYASGGVEESEEQIVAQALGKTLAWDLSNLSAEKLAAAESLQIVWYPEDHPPSSGFTYNGSVLIDNIRLVDDSTQLTRAKISQKHRDLIRAHGPMLDQEIQSQTDMVQTGVYNYYDETEVPYRIELLSNGDIEETIDGETFYWEEDGQ